MKLLLDSHVLLWSLFEPKQLRPEVQAHIKNSENLVFISIVSLWEIRIKESLGRLPVKEGFYEGLERGGYEILGISLAHIHSYGLLPFHHRDPFDRMLIAQAQTEEMTLVTRDPLSAKYKVNVLGA